MLQFCVTQSHVKQRAIAKKSGLLSQHETPPQLLNATGRSWSCVFFGTEQRKKGNGSHHFLARAAHLPIPFSRTHFSLKIGCFTLLQWQDIFTKYTQVGICQCAVGFCLHHISEAEPVEFIIRSELLISGFHKYLVYFDHSSVFSPSSLGIRIDIYLIIRPFWPLCPEQCFRIQW